MASKVVTKVTALVAPVCVALGYELVDVEYRREGGRYVLRLAIDKPGGITIADCEQVSRAVDPVLDEADPIPGSYLLEVSSPGLDRPLKRPADFDRFAGAIVKIRSFSPIAGRRTWQGRLIGWRDGQVLIEQDGGELGIPFAEISKAQIVPQL